MNEDCNRADRSCGDNCKETRRQVAKVMALFGIVIVGLGWYILSQGILQKALN